MGCDPLAFYSRSCLSSWLSLVPMATSLSSSSSSSPPAESIAYLKGLQRRVTDLLQTLASLEPALRPPPLSSSSTSSPPFSSVVLQRLSLALTQAEALLDDALLSPSLSTPLSSRRFFIQPLRAGFNPSDQARTKLEPEDELAQSQALVQFLIEQRENEERQNKQREEEKENEMRGEEDESSTSNSSSSPLAALVARLQEHNLNVASLKPLLLEHAAASSTSLSSLSLSAPSSTAAPAASRAAIARKELEENQLKKVLLVLQGRSLR